ncbi:MAG: hypothetical protein WDW36_007290 [Sanguina aurantia]
MPLASATALTAAPSGLVTATAGVCTSGGEDHARCSFYQKAYQSLCPSDWLEAWTELREKGLWTGKY